MSDRFDHTLEHTLESKADEPGDTGLVRRFEVITGTGRRRQWSENEKARIIIESLKPGANVSEVARRNGLSPQQLFGWRREARELMAETAGSSDTPASGLARSSAPSKRASGARPLVDSRPTAEVEPAFASVVIAAATPLSPPSPPQVPPASGRIEIAIGDEVVRVVGQVEAAHLTAVLRAVRRAS